MSGMSGWGGGFQQAVPLPPDVVNANGDQLNAIASAGSVMTANLTPTFYPIIIPAVSVYPLDSLMVKVTALEAAKTVGVAIYSYTVPSNNNLSATRVAQVNAALSGAAASTVKGQVTAGAAGAGAATVNLDFTQNRYLVGVMVDSVATMALLSTNVGPTFVDMNLVKWNSAARSTTTDWPTTFDQTNVVNTGTSRFATVWLMTAIGANAI